MAFLLRRIKGLVNNPRNELLYASFFFFISFDRSFKTIWKLIDQIPGWLSKSESYLLYYLARKCTPLCAIAEIGSYEGKSTISIAAGAAEGVIINAIDPHTGDKTQVENGLIVDSYGAFLKNTENFKNIHPIKKFSIDATNDILGGGIQLLFIDGWHSEDAVNIDIQMYLPLCNKNFTIVFDDWTNFGVSAAIKKNLELLPPVIGCIGKDLIFSNDRNVTNSILAKIIAKLTPKSVFFYYKSD